VTRPTQRPSAWCVHQAATRLAPALILCVALGLGLAMPPGSTGRVSAAPPAQPTLPAPSIMGDDSPPEPLAFPSRAPDMAAGRALFAERCASCHGPQGRGDGSMAGGLPAPPPSLADPEAFHGMTTAELYDVVTNGRIEQLMPPWRGSLDVEQRWDAVAGAWSWSLTPTRLAQGRSVWQAQCAQCHAEDGNALAAAPLGDLETTAERDGAQLLADTRDLPEAHDGLAALDETTLRLAIDYMRALPFRDELAERIEADGVLAGRVVKGGDGEVDLATVVVEARPVAGEVPGAIQTLEVDDEGRFRAEGMPAGEDVLWLLAATLDDVSYPLAEPIAATRASNAADADSETGGAEEEAASSDSESVENAEGRAGDALELVVFAPDPDAPVGLLSLRALVSPLPDQGVVEVLERWVVVNRTGRARVVGDEPGSATLRLPLPDGARFLRFADSRMQDVARIEDGLLLDRLPVPPGEREVLLSYRVPYVGESLSLDRTLAERVGEVTLVVADAQARIESAALTERAPTDFDGQTFERVGGKMLESGVVIDALLTGLPTALSSPQMALAPLPAPPVSPRTLAILALALAGLATGLALAQPLLAARRGPGDSPRSRASTAAQRRMRERALARLEALEREHRAGDLAPKVYARRRARLMERAMAVAPPSAVEDPAAARGPAAGADA